MLPAGVPGRECSLPKRDPHAPKMRVRAIDLVRASDKTEGHRGRTRSLDNARREWVKEGLDSTVAGN